jgi:hypothetical protein
MFSVISFASLSDNPLPCHMDLCDVETWNLNVSGGGDSGTRAASGVTESCHANKQDSRIKVKLLTFEPHIPVVWMSI